MDAFEIKKILDTFQIIVDTREQPTNRALNRYDSFGAPWRRQTLNYGDYTYDVTLLNGEQLHRPDQRANPHCYVERKQNLDELAMCFTRGRDRFRREFERASEHSAKGYLLVENASWELLIKGQYRSRIKPKAFLASICAWQVRYNLTVIFCDMDTSGTLIREILYRDLKERLEREEFTWRNEADGLKFTDS